MEGSVLLCRLLCFQSEISLMLNKKFMNDFEGVFERCYKIPRANCSSVDLTWIVVQKSAFL